ncbi:rod shape determining protein RodA [Pilibacter termitis]|uniref:Rod shape determining protein RodA n=1 Tax=Pilibacter termitis TaxID=263852 RepID=A0A1T4PI83_9ENTE|nr:FtsW/RodA/SpoVE family cell cycle protein [Pilibacter termitis]SJZ91270.1 rod shape determining protein RodA [Pilibacter termitis]
MENRRRRQIDNRIDYGVILPVFLLCLIGLLALYIAYSHSGTGENVLSKVAQQGIWMAIGVFAVFITIHFSNKMLWLLTPIFYGVGLIINILPRFFFSPALLERTGSYNWIVIGNKQLFQPSELLKLAYILVLAYVITQHNAYYTHRVMRSDVWLILKMSALTAPMAVLLLFVQNDFGTFLVFVAIFLGMLLLTGISWKILVPLYTVVISSGALGLFLVTNDVGREFLRKFGVQSYKFARIDTWLDPWKYSSGNGYQQARGLLAIGSGGLTGKGFNVSQVHVPVRESDMIFTVIGEDFGFIGSTFVILLYFILIYRMVRVTFESNNEFYTYISTGIIMMILFHVLENIGANIGLLPLTGIPLPFISQGGTSLVGNMIGIGLILSMKYHQKPDFEEWKESRSRRRV